MVPIKNQDLFVARHHFRVRPVPPRSPFREGFTMIGTQAAAVAPGNWITRTINGM
jgi:hypothetical protein